jgi:hypothetical protein
MGNHRKYVNVNMIAEHTYGQIMKRRTIMNCNEKLNKININYYDCGKWGADCCEGNNIIGNNGNVPSIGENGNWFIGEVDTGISAKGTAGEQGVPGPQGPKGEPGDLNESSLMLRPDLWEVNKEYQFGNGLYGRRFKGEITEKPAIANALLLGNLGVTAKVRECDGSWHHGTADIMLGNAASSNVMSRLSITDTTVGYAKGDLVLATVSNVQRTNSPYDIWVKYTK